MEKQTDIIADIEKELTKLELEKKQKRKNERTCRDKREKIKAKIQQLQKESSEQLLSTFILKIFTSSIDL
jgi:hypothetical protein